jgi:tetratricopeptide (TPR) repeat protein
MGIFCFNLGDYRQQVEACRKVRALLTQKGGWQVPGMAGLPGAISNSLLALGLAELGDFQEIDEIGGEVFHAVEQGGNLFTRAAASNYLAMAYLRFMNTRRALQLLEDSYRNCRQYQMKAPYSFTLTILGHAYLLSKEPGRAQSVLEEATQEEDFKAAYWLKTYLFTILAETYQVLGKMDLAKETMFHALETAKVREERGMEAWAMLVMGGIQIKEGKLEDALEWYQQGLKQASDLFMRPLIGHLHRAIGEAYDRLGRREEAQTELEKALGMYRTLGMVHWLDS